eukprot:4064294-Pyramimonas_sp.AAC.1
MIAAIDEVRVKGDSCGGVVTCVMRNVPKVRNHTPGCGITLRAAESHSGLRNHTPGCGITLWAAKSHSVGEVVLRGAKSHTRRGGPRARARSARKSHSELRNHTPGCEITHQAR